MDGRSSIHRYRNHEPVLGQGRTLFHHLCSIEILGLMLLWFEPRMTMIYWLNQVPVLLLVVLLLRVVLVFELSGIDCEGLQPIQGTKYRHLILVLHGVVLLKFGGCLYLVWFGPTTSPHPRCQVIRLLGSFGIIWYLRSCKSWIILLMGLVVAL